MGGPPEPKPQVPALDPATQQLADQQSKTAADFQANAGDVMQQQGNMAQQASNSDLAQKNKQTVNSANSRGLLYSGMKQGQLAQNQGASAANLASNQANINNNVNSQAQGFNQTALNSQMGVQNLQTQRQALAYNISKG